MKSLKESILADMDDVLKSGDKQIKESIKLWLKNNLGKGVSSIKISRKPNLDGKYEVSSKGAIVYKKSIHLTSLTNDLFIWNNVDGNFDCSDCHSLKTLEGAPKEVSGDFNCSDCNSLKTLEGAPEKVESGFYCINCTSLQTLEGAPKEVGGEFDCAGCISLKTLEGAPEEVHAGFDCSHCDSLISLKGAPKKIKGMLDCIKCTNLQSLEGCPYEIGSARFNFTKLTSLEGGPKKVKYGFSCGFNKYLTSLKGCPEEVGGNFSVTDCPNLIAFDDCPKSVNSFYFERNGLKLTTADIHKRCKIKTIVVAN